MVRVLTEVDRIAIDGQSRARWWAAGSEALRAEFRSFDRFAAHERALAAGQVKVVAGGGIGVAGTGGDSMPTTNTLEATAKQDWTVSPQIRAEFCGNLERYIAFRRGFAEGRIRVFSGRASMGRAIEIANAAARDLSLNVAQQCLKLWSANAKIRGAFGHIGLLKSHIENVRARSGGAPLDLPPAA